MPFIKLALDDVKEPEPVAEGTYDLRITKAMDTESKKGNPMTVITIRIEDAGIKNPSAIIHYMTYPDEDLPEEQRNYRLLDIKRFLSVFGIKYDPHGFDTDELVGATATKAMVVQESGDDDIIRNKLRLPRLKE